MVTPVLTDTPGPVTRLFRKEAVATVGLVAAIIVAIAGYLSGAGVVFPPAVAGIIGLASWIQRANVFSANTVEQLFLNLERALMEDEVYAVDVQKLADQAEPPSLFDFDALDTPALPDPDEQIPPAVP